MTNQFTAPPIEVRFDENVIPEPNSGCFLWIGAVNGHGYGTIRLHGQTWQAHRLAWTMANGPIPTGTCILHRCDNPACVNTHHLFTGSMADNSRDMLNKGRHAGQSVTVCKQGHPYTPENTLLKDNKKHRSCRACNLKRSREGHRARYRANPGPKLAACRAAYARAKAGKERDRG